MTKQILSFKKELIWLDYSYENKEELFQAAGSTLYELGYVKESFAQALGQRESNYPTGLPTEPFHVAIPHTDAIHVNKEAIACIRLTKPVSFVNMGDPLNEVSAEFVFILCILDPQNQVGVLTALIEALANAEVMNGLKQAENTGEIFALLTEMGS